MTIKEMVVKLGVDADVAAFATAELSVHLLEKALEKVVETAKELGKAFVENILEMAEKSEKIQNMAMEFGVTADQLQRLGYAAGEAGLQMESLGPAISFMARNGVKDINGEFLKLAEHMKKMPNDGRRVQYAIEHLGRAGKELIPLLAKGREELQELFSDAPIIDPATLEAGAEFEHTLYRLKGQLTQLKNAVFGPMMKPLGDILKGFLAWVRVHREMISGGINTFLGKVVDALKMLWQLLEPIVALLKLSFDGWVMLYHALEPFFPLLEGLAVLWAAIEAPMLLVLAVMEDIYTWMQGGDSLFGELITAIGKFIDVLKEKWQSFLDLLKTTYTNVKNGVLEYFDRIVEKVKEALGQLSKYADVLKIIGMIPGFGAVGAAGMLAGQFGAGASPGASAGASPLSPQVLAPTVKAEFNITSPSADPKEVAGATVEQWQSWFDTQLRVAAAGT